MVYGATGTTSLPAIFESVSGIVATGGSSTLFLLLGAGMIIVGLGFKVAVVPFHMWTPDVYEGAPTPITAFMSVGAKAGGFAALLRVVIVALPTFVLQDDATGAAWQATVSLIAALTLIFGNLVAIAQTNVKRLLAYSSIAHAGYILMAVAAVGSEGVSEVAARGALVYMLEDFIGLSKSKPILALAMAIFMLSLTGIPPTAGFVGKWLVFGATLDAGLVVLAIIGVLTSVVSAFYYVRIIVNMYLQGDEETEGPAAAGATRYVEWTIYATMAGTLIVGIFPTVATNLTDAVLLASSVVP
jgi:NADH-quinone oxidoreductase subunit N